MPESLSDEQILEISDEPEVSTADSVESTIESTGQYGDESQQAETATETESQSKEQQVANQEEREPAKYEDLGSPDELRALVDAERQIFSADRNDNRAWVQEFSKAHGETFHRLIDLSLDHIRATNPTKWTKIEQSIGQGAFTADRVWDWLEATYAANSGNPAAQEIANQFAVYLNARFGIGPTEQTAQPALNREALATADRDMHQHFEKQVEEELSHLRSMPEYSRAYILRQVHSEIQNALRANDAYADAVKQLLRSGAPNALDQAKLMTMRAGVNLLPAIIKRWRDAIPVPIGQAEANSMDPRAILSSDRPADSRAGRTRNRPARLTRDEVNRLDPRKLLDYGPVVVRK